MPAVSIVVPNYNHARFLKKRLDSIFEQSFQDFELIFLDDASTDQSREVFEAYESDPRVTAIFNETNSGSPFVQWNKGFSLARGTYVWLAESDDFADANFLQVLVDVLNENPGAGLAYSQSMYVDKNDKLLGAYTYGLYEDHERWDHDFQNSGQDEVKRYFSISNVIPNASAVLIRRSVIQSGVMAPENLRLAGDWQFWISVLLRTDLCYVATPMNYFRIMHDASQRSRSLNDGSEILEGLAVQRFLQSRVALSDEELQVIVSRRIRHWMFVHRERKFRIKVNKRIFIEFVNVLSSGSSRSPLAAKANVGSRAVLYYLLQIPVIKRTFAPIWHWFNKNVRKKSQDKQAVA